MIAITHINHGTYTDCDSRTIGSTESDFRWVNCSRPFPVRQESQYLPRIPSCRPRNAVFLETEDENGNVTTERIFLPFVPYRKRTRKEVHVVPFHRAMGNANKEERSK